MLSRILLTVAMAVLAGGCSRGGGGSDDLLDRMIAAVTPAGKVLHVEAREFPEGQEDSAQRVSVWIDGDEDASRYERLREWPGGSADYVRVGVGWGWSEYDADANDVDEGEVPEEGSGRERLRDPTVLALTYLWMLATADEWTEEEGSEDGRRVIVVESRVVLRGDGRDIAEGTELMTTLTLDKRTLWPVRQQTRTVQPDGEEQETAIVEFDSVELLTREELPAGLFSRDAVREAFITLDEKIAEATARGFTVYWLGKENAQSGLELEDIRVTSGASERVVLSYGTDQLQYVNLVSIWEEKGASVSRTNCDSVGLEEESVSVAGGGGTLTTTRYQAHCLTLAKDGTAISLNTVPLSDAGEDRNPFNNRDALITLAGALVPAE